MEKSTASEWFQGRTPSPTAEAGGDLGPVNSYQPDDV